MTTIALITFGILVATLVYTLHRLWQVHRRGRIREAEAVTQFMEATLRQRREKPSQEAISRDARDVKRRRSGNSRGSRTTRGKTS